MPGNDLARVLRWGSGYTSEDPHHILVSVDEAEEVLMDRWTILLDAQDVSGDGSNNQFLEPPKVRFQVHFLFIWFHFLFIRVQFGPVWTGLDRLVSPLVCL